MKSVLDLSCTKAREYLLQSEQYCTFKLPEYINFSKVLYLAENNIKSKDFSACCAKNPSECEGLTYTLFSNKDGLLDFRPLSLINPFYYYIIVRYITTPKNWKSIKNRFNDLKNTHISVESIPLYIESKRAAKTIYEWWNNVEQMSIVKSLSYRYMATTDIANCYGSFYTHAISWAMHGRKEGKNNRRDKSLLGNCIDEYIRGMQNGQTNGIPQGNIVSDLIAELVLSYVDSELCKELDKKKINQYHIIRYRDDYRIFSNDKDELESILLIMQKVLAICNFKINASKTHIYDDIVLASIKADKIKMITGFRHHDVSIGQKVEDEDYDDFEMDLDDSVDVFEKGHMKRKQSIAKVLYQELLSIYLFSKVYQNSGSVEKLLSELYDWLTLARIKMARWMVLAAILLAIARYNPRTYGIVAAFLSFFVDTMDNETAREELINSVVQRVKTFPNNSLMLLWLQRLTKKIGKDIDYEEPLCRLVDKEKTNIWNNDWLHKGLLKDYSDELIVDEGIMNSINTIISKKEVSPFYNY